MRLRTMMSCAGPRTASGDLCGRVNRTAGARSRYSDVVFTQLKEARSAGWQKFLPTGRNSASPSSAYASLFASVRVLPRDGLGA